MRRRVFFGVAGTALTGASAATLLRARTAEAGALVAGPAAESTILELERTWMEAMVRRDEGVLRRLMADDFKRVQEPWPNFSMTKAQWLAIALREYRIESFKLLEGSVRFSEGTAVAASRYRWRGALGEMPINETVTAEDTWKQTDGSWQVVSQFIRKAEKTGRTAESVAPRKVAKIDPAIYAAYIGQYRFGGSRVLTISREGGRLMHQGSGGQRAELFPETTTRFFRRDASVLTIFVKKAGEVTHVVHRHRDGRESIGKRVA